MQKVGVPDDVWKGWELRSSGMCVPLSHLITPQDTLGVATTP
jgi:hypothetical protein